MWGGGGANAPRAPPLLRACCGREREAELLELHKKKKKKKKISALLSTERLQTHVFTTITKIFVQ